MADMLKAILENFLGRLRSSALLLPMVETCRISSQFFGWWARRPEIFYEVTFKHCDPAACPRNQRTYLTVVRNGGRFRQRRAGPCSIPEGNYGSPGQARFHRDCGPAQ
jgi:hypothetical protein